MAMENSEGFTKVPFQELPRVNASVKTNSEHLQILTELTQRFDLLIDNYSVTLMDADYLDTIKQGDRLLNYYDELHLTATDVLLHTHVQLVLLKLYGLKKERKYLDQVGVFQSRFQDKINKEPLTKSHLDYTKMAYQLVLLKIYQLTQNQQVLFEINLGFSRIFKYLVFKNNKVRLVNPPVNFDSARLSEVLMEAYHLFQNPAFLYLYNKLQTINRGTAVTNQANFLAQPDWHLFPFITLSVAETKRRLLYNSFPWTMDVLKYTHWEKLNIHLSQQVESKTNEINSFKAFIKTLTVNKNQELKSTWQIELNAYRLSEKYTDKAVEDITSKSMFRQITDEQLLQATVGLQPSVKCFKIKWHSALKPHIINLAIHEVVNREDWVALFYQSQKNKVERIVLDQLNTVILSMLNQPVNTQDLLDKITQPYNDIEERGEVINIVLRRIKQLIHIGIININAHSA